MKFKKKIENVKIVVPTAYLGSAEPQEPKEGDVWQNQYTDELCVYLGNKWFKVWNVIETGYTEEEKREMQEKEKAEMNELEKSKRLLKDFSKLLNEILECD